jgi:translation initiation factor eIF-2B subunit delta
VVDCRPLHAGLSTVSELSKHVECVYTPLAGVLSILSAGTVSMVLLGASGVLANGAVLAPAGTATVAALAQTRKVEVWVAAESFKLSERVHLDSVVYNEMGSEYVRDPHAILPFSLVPKCVP